MDITLIHPYPDPSAYGLRVLRAVLKRDGHRVRFVNLPDFTGDEATVAVERAARRYPRRALDQLCDVVADSDIVGVSLMTNFFATAVEITTAIRRELPEKLIVWGGIHPTIRPDECLEHCDVAVVGEAEDSMRELARRVEAGEDWSDVPGLAFRRNGELVETDIPPLQTELDQLPAPDIVAEDQWLLHDGELMPVTDEVYVQMMARTTASALYGKVGYQTMTSRGCPHRCAYCVNSTIRGLYPGQRYVRFRSVESVIDELTAVLRRYPQVDYMWFSDDVFFARPLKDLQRFSALYLEKIGLPFYMLASPTSLTEEKYKTLVDAGLHHIQMGIESGSPRIQEVFQRERMGNEKVLKAAKIIAKYADQTQIPYYDFITNIPWEDDEARRETLQLIAQLPKPFKLQLFSLVLYPATVAYDRACAEGKIAPAERELYDAMYQVRDDTYLNLVLSLSSKGLVPGWLVDAMADNKLDPVISSPPVRAAEEVTRRALKTVRRLRDFNRHYKKMTAMAS
jgi:anaerobic magnesium-protoporphyrin IX monomethyl ester cyclase